jgi:hypothetical protein
MGDWDRAKGIARGYVVQEQADRVAILSRLALDLYSRRRRTFSRQEFISTAAGWMPGYISAPYDIAEAVLNELTRDSLIVEQPGGQLAFFHFSIHEYLAAAALAGQVSLEPVWRAVTEYFRDGWWEEVLVFYAGIKRDVAALLPDLHRHLTSSTYAHTDHLWRILDRWLAVADFTDPQTVKASGSVARVLHELDERFELPELMKAREQGKPHA